MTGFQEKKEGEKWGEAYKMRRSMEDILLLILDFAGQLHIEEDEEDAEKGERGCKLGEEFRISSS